MDIVLDHTAQRQLKRTPKNIVKKLRDWVVSVMERGLREVAKRPGYHDEPLRGERRGQRSIRLSRLWRAIYRPVPARITIETVTPHDYRVRGAAEVEALPFLNELLGEPASAEAQMDRTTKKQVLATLLRAGRRDLARVVAASPIARSFADAQKKLQAAERAFEKLETEVGKLEDSDAKVGVQDELSGVVGMLEELTTKVSDLEDYIGDL